jgi:mono/diheme cytochrome c family protein
MRYEMTPRITQPGPSASESESLFAYLYSLAHFDAAGDARRGERTFRDRQCGSCHGAIPSEWRLTDRFALVQALWNHAGAMERSRSQQNLSWPTMTGRDIADLAAYIVREQRLGDKRLEFPPASVGKALFEANCNGCHPSIVPLDRRLRNKTLGDIAAGMWNHLPKMQRVPLIADNDMNAIVGYVWQESLDRQGNVGRGRRAFEEKRCAACHADFFRGDRVLTPYSLMSAAWKHDPLSARYEGRRWPTLSSEDVADLVAYLNSRP